MFIPLSFDESGRLSLPIPEAFRYHDRIKCIRILLKEAQELSLFTELGKYLVVNRKNAPELFRHLDAFGFFEYHETKNDRDWTYVHQISAYATREGGQHHFHKGGRCRKGELEVHHLDGNTHNNHPDNLEYLTPLENKLLAQIPGGYNRSFLKKLGCKVRDTAEFTKLMYKTCIAHFARLGCDMTGVAVEYAMKKMRQGIFKFLSEAINQETKAQGSEHEWQVRMTARKAVSIITA